MIVDIMDKIKQMDKLDALFAFLIIMVTLTFLVNVIHPSNFALETFKTSFATLLMMTGLKVNKNV